MKLWTGSLLLFSCIAVPVMGAPVCFQSQNRLLYTPVPKTSAFLDKKFNELSPRADRLMNEAQLLLHRLESSKEGNLAIEESLVETIQKATLEYHSTDSNDPAANQAIIAKVTNALEFSKYFAAMKSEGILHIAVSLIRELPPGAHEHQIKGSLLYILGVHNRFTSQAQADLAQETLIALREVNSIFVDMESIAAASSKMPQIRSLQDYREALFSLPVEIQKELGLPASTLHKVTKFAAEYQKADMPAFDFLTAGQAKVIAEFKELIEADPTLGKLSEETQATIAGRVGAMTSREAAALTIAEIASSEKPKLKDMITRYGLLRRIQSLVDVGLMEAPAGRPN